MRWRNKDINLTFGSTTKYNVSVNKITLCLVIEYKNKLSMTHVCLIVDNIYNQNKRGYIYENDIILTMNFFVKHSKSLENKTLF